MGDTSKEKRKGPRRNRLSPVITVVLLVAIAWVASRAFSLLLVETISLPRGVSGGAVTFLDFDISEGSDQVGLAWAEGTQTDAMVVTCSWRGLKNEDDTGKLRGWTPEGIALTSIGLHPHEDLIFYLDSNHNLHLQDSHGFQNPSNILQATYSPDGTWFALLSPARVALYQLRGTNPSFFDMSRATTMFPLTTITPHALAISPDETMLAVAGDDPDNTTSLLLYDIKTVDLKAQLELPHGSTMTLAFHPSKPELAVGLDNVLYRLDTIPGGTQSFSVPLGQINSIDYDSTGRWMAITGLTPDMKTRDVYVYDLTSEMEPPTRFHPSTQSMPVKGQFVKDGLVIGEQRGVFTLWQWQENAWTQTRVWPIAFEWAYSRFLN